MNISRVGRVLKKPKLDSFFRHGLFRAAIRSLTFRFRKPRKRALALQLWLTLIAILPRGIPAAPQTVVFKSVVYGISKDSLALQAGFGIHLKDSANYEFQIDLARKGLVINKGVRTELSDSNEFFDSLTSAPKFIIDNSNVSATTYSGIFMEYAHVPYFTLIETKLTPDTLTRLFLVCVGDSGAGKAFPQSCSSSSGMEMMVVGRDTSTLNLSGKFATVSTSLFARQEKVRSISGIRWSNDFIGLRLDTPVLGETNLDISDVLGRAYRVSFSGTNTHHGLPGSPFFILGDFGPSGKNPGPGRTESNRIHREN